MIVYANAKINLILDITGKREDGYHLLSSVFTALDLRDIIEINSIQKNEIIITSTSSNIPLNRDNLAYKAADYMKETFHISRGVTIHIKKNIPISAGLGGGSSDAAAVIFGMNQLFKLTLSKKQMAKLGEKIGADVPYFIYGGTCFVEGIGEVVTPIPSIPFSWIVLIKPHFGVSTRTIFENVKLENILHPNIKMFLESLKSKKKKEYLKYMGNSLEDITFELSPEVRKIKNRLIEKGYCDCMMSGSGPTIFCFANNKKQAKKIAGLFSSEKYDVIITKTKGNTVS